jgi:hypothetical protein
MKIFNNNSFQNTYMMSLVRVQITYMISLAWVTGQVDGVISSLYLAPKLKELNTMHYCNTGHV